MIALLSLPLAVAYFLPGSAKASGHRKMQESAAHFGVPWSRYRLIGAAELAAGLGVVIGIWWPAAGIAAALGMTLLLVGALVTHRLAGDAVKDAMPAAVVLAITIAYLAVVLSR